MWVGRALVAWSGSVAAWPIVRPVDTSVSAHMRCIVGPRTWRGQPERRCTAVPGISHPDHVVVVMMENHSDTTSSVAGARAVLAGAGRRRGVVHQLVRDHASERAELPGAVLGVDAGRDQRRVPADLRDPQHVTALHRGRCHVRRVLRRPSRSAATPGARAVRTLESTRRGSTSPTMPSAVTSVTASRGTTPWCRPSRS